MIIHYDQTPNNVNENGKPYASITLDSNEISILRERLPEISQKRALSYDEACIMKELFDVKCFMQNNSYWDYRTAKTVEKLLSPEWKN